jgi:hypothetical protein
VNTREERLVENEETFRRANELLVEVVEQQSATPSVIPFLCECADDLCLGRVELTSAAYQDVRAHDNRFVIIGGHLQAEAEHVVDKLGPYEIVEKE